MIATTKKYGFCKGVSFAHKCALDALDAPVTGKKYLYGDLVNNSLVMQDLVQRGFEVLDAASPATVRGGDVVVIRAHGVPRDVLRSFGDAQHIDCTCAKVKKIHKIVESAGAQNQVVAVVGKRGHPETVGIVGWCTGPVAIIENDADIEAIDAPAVCVVAQTTASPEWFEQACKKISARVKKTRIHNTICTQTSQNLQAAQALAAQSDIFVVVGDEKSSNAGELHKACREKCANTFFVPDYSRLDMKSVQLPGKTVGIAGSMSTPPQAVRDVEDYLQFLQFLAEARDEIDSALASTDHPSNFSDMPEVADIQAAFAELNKGGKRLRGALIKLGCYVGYGHTSIAHYLFAACAYEIFQTAILIHDDIIDQAAMRRGRPTIHATAENPHMGISRAICAGDYGFFMANLLMGLDSASPARTLTALRLFSNIQVRTIHGEILDVGLPERKMDILRDFDEYMRTVREIYLNKTAWYTIIGPLLLGAYIAGTSIGTAAAIEKLAAPLGVAFQIKDDLLGIYADEAEMGKPSLADIAEKKHTLMYGHAYRYANAQQRTRLEASYGAKNPTMDDLACVREIFTETGAAAFARTEIKTLCDVSLKRISELEGMFVKNLRYREAKKIAGLLRGLAHYIRAGV